MSFEQTSCEILLWCCRNKICKGLLCLRKCETTVHSYHEQTNNYEIDYAVNISKSFPKVSDVYI